MLWLASWNSTVPSGRRNQAQEPLPPQWGNQTMKGAHLYILEHFAELVDGDVVDVQFHVLHETDRLRVSERFIVPATESIANTANKPKRLARRF